MYSMLVSRKNISFTFRRNNLTPFSVEETQKDGDVNDAKTVIGAIHMTAVNYAIVMRSVR